MLAKKVYQQNVLLNGEQKKNIEKIETDLKLLDELFVHFASQKVKEIQNNFDLLLYSSSSKRKEIYNTIFSLADIKLQVQRYEAMINASLDVDYEKNISFKGLNNVEKCLLELKRINILLEANDFFSDEIVNNSVKQMIPSSMLRSILKKFGIKKVFQKRLDLKNYNITDFSNVITESLWGIMLLNIYNVKEDIKGQLIQKHYSTENNEAKAVIFSEKKSHIA